MGLFDMFKKKAEPAAAAAPASISASAGADVLCSPVKGKVIKTVPEDQIVDTLLTIANDIAAQMEARSRLWWRGSGQGLCRVARGRSGLRSLRR